MANPGILSGAGQFMFLTQSLSSTIIAQELMFAPDLINFTLAENLGTPRKAKKLTCDGPVIIGVAHGLREATLTVSSEVPNWSFLQLAAGELAENVNVTLPLYKQATVPLTTPFTITDPAITAANLAQIRSYNSSFVGTTQPGTLMRVTVAPASAKEFQAAAGTLTFSSGAAGQTITYSVPTPYTSMPSLNKSATPIKLGELQFIGHACGDSFDNGVLIHIKRLSQTTKPTWNPNQDVPAFEIQYECLLAPDERELVQYYLPPIAA